ncbi:MAG TPA: hypothetical protein VMX97_16425 [Hyphomicrobiaceae bacterium]|nr:hypothetical protein [Hyphomicrobiaceae bacterium]
MSNTLNPFEASRLKLARARQHIDEFKKKTDAYLAREPFAIVVDQPKMWVDMNCQAWCAKIHEPIDAGLSGILGDAIHNLRTSLDLLATDLVVVAGKNPKSVHFPFADSQSGLADQIKRKNFHRAGSAAVDLLKFLKPYKGGNEGLRALHDLDVMDKHKALVPVAQSVVMNLSGMLPKDAPQKSKDDLSEWGTRISENDQQVVIMPMAWGLPLGTKIKCSFALILAEPKFVAGQELVGLLNEFARIVEVIIEEFERTVT